MSELRPIPGDTGGEDIAVYFDLAAEDWLLSTEGEYSSCAVETMNKDGGGYQRLVALQWPTRRNHTHEEVLVRLLIHPEDIPGLVKVLAETTLWLLSAEQLGK